MSVVVGMVMVLMSTLFMVMSCIKSKQIASYSSAHMLLLRTCSEFMVSQEHSVCG
jgi:hypothetical protein